MATRIDGRAITAEILASVKERVDGIGHVPVVRAIVMAPTAATESYLRIKTARAEEAGMRLELVTVNSESEILEAIAASNTDAVIVQLPLPATVNERRILDAIPLEKDADVLSNLAYERFLTNEKGALLPPVVSAVSEILNRAGVSVAGKRVVVIGNGRLVGAPVRAWLAREGADITVLTRDDFNEKKDFLKQAEIVVSGAGSPRLVTPGLLTPGAVLIDAGTSESNGAIVGDFDPACADVASVFTPVPGGVGPIAVACLFNNAAELLGR